ncbi:MAG: c-type cytochrome [Flavisolibacter sp.]|nr:c-type cytochrome [Flavisolibacter sp.]
MKRPFLVIVGLALVVSISMAFTEDLTKDDPLYTNLQILPKDITKEQMDSVMHHFTDALSVRCNFCHVRNDSTRKYDFASDAVAHKRKARDMMRLTDKINDDYFDVTGGQRTINTQLMVTCYTCHHGSTDPEVRAPKKQESSLRFQGQPLQVADSAKKSQ